MSWNISLTLSQLGTKSLHIYACRWIFISAITQHETKLQRKSISGFLLSHRTEMKINNPLVVHPGVPVFDVERRGPYCGVSWATPQWSPLKTKKGGKGRSKAVAAACFILCLSQQHSQFACLRREKCQTRGLCTLNSTQIRLVLDLGNINNSLERYMCEWECNSSLLGRLGNARSGKVGQRGKIRAIGCKRSSYKFICRFNGLTYQRNTVI